MQMNPFEVQPSDTDHAGSESAGMSSVRFLFWDGERLIPCSPDARERCHASQAPDTASDADGWRRAAVIPDGDDLFHEFERNGGAEITYWVPVGDELVPSTPERAERFRENDRELVAQHRLQVWLREERRRARWRLPRRVALALRTPVASGARRIRALARGSGMPRLWRDHHARTQQPIEQAGQQK